jgi:hypothetical protein
VLDLAVLAEVSLGVLAALAAYGWDRTLTASASPMPAYALTRPSSQEPL